MNTHEVVDFGPGPKDETLGYPFRGTEEECSTWITANQPSGRDRFALQEIPEEKR